MAHQFSVIYIRDPMTLRKIAWSQYLRPAMIRTRQILLGFYPSVKITSRFMSHDRELVLVCMESQNSDQNISLEIWPAQCG
jgi:hypothetical protein